MEENTQLISFNEIVILGMLLMLFVALSIVSTFLVFQRRIILQQRTHQQKETQHQKQQLRALLQGQERERHRLSRDLHDEVGALLTTIKLYFGSLEQHLEPQKFDELKTKVFELLETSVTTVRNVSHDLKPIVLEQMGLTAAIANAIHHLNETNEIAIDFEHQLVQKLNKEAEINWYRIFQELINNTLKHAAATHITIRFFEADNQVHLVYTDNGNGISPNLDFNPGIGMKNIESRLNLMNGTYELEKPPKGFKICMRSDF
ncbi:MAG: sensor histidine kinase [Salibacteraceae bacterium]